MKLSGHYFLTSWSGTVNWYWISVLDHVAGMRNPKTGFSISWRCGLGFYLVIITTDELTCVTGLDLNSNFTASLGQLVLELGHPHSGKKCFLMFRGNLLWFSVGLLPLVLSLGTIEKTWLHPLCTFPSGIYVYVVKTLWAFSKLTIHSSFSLSF